MINKLSILLVCLCFWISLSGQSPEDSLAWVVGFQDEGLSPFLLETDSDNNIIVAGVYTGCEDCFVNYQGDTLFSKGNETDDIFLAKLDSNGTLVQYLVFGSNGDDALAGLEVDINNHIILYIRNLETFDLNNKALQQGHNVLKLNSHFDLIWVTHVKGATHNVITGNLVISPNYVQFAVNHQNEILLYGSIDFVQNNFDTLIIDGHPVTAEESNIFIAKLNHNGNLKWIRVLEHEGRLTPSSLTISDEDEIILIGNYFFQDWIINNDTLHIDTTVNKNQGVGYILTYDNKGELQWFRRYHQNLQPKHLDTDNKGNTIVTGVFNSYAFIGEDTIFTFGAASDQLFLKFDHVGNLVWSKRMGDQSSNQFVRIAFNSNRDFFITGALKKPNIGPVLFKFSEAANELWNINPDPSNRMGAEMDFDVRGHLITSGTYFSSFSIGMDTLHNSPDWGEYIFKLGNQTAPVVVDSFLGELLIQYNNATCARDNGSAKIESSIGIEFQTVLWSNGSTMDSITGLGSGEYSVTVTDKNGNSMSASIMIDSIPVDSLMMYSVNTTCGNSDGIAFVTTSDNSPILSYLWNTGDTLSQIENLAGGTYFVSTTDVNGCLSVGEVSIIGFLNPVVELGDDIILFQGDEVELDATGNDFTYIWSTGETTPKIIVNSPGIYSVTVTNSDHCSASDSVMVTNIVSSKNIGVDMNVTIWPNPVSDFIYILSNTPLEFQFKLFDLTGKLLYSGQARGQINMSEYQEGFYLIEFIHKSSGIKFVKKIFVSR